jgi:nucleoside-diphosphate-sugar epimerase
VSKSTDRDNSFDDRWEIDMDLLGQLIGQHLKLYPLFENITILGCGYIGKALAEYWQEAGHLVAGATRCRELEVLPIESTLKIVPIDGNDLTAMSSLMTGQNTLVVSPASAQSIDVAHYQTAYLNTVMDSP